MPANIGMLIGIRSTPTNHNTFACVDIDMDLHPTNPLSITLNGLIPAGRFSRFEEMKEAFSDQDSMFLEDGKRIFHAADPAR